MDTYKKVIKFKINRRPHSSQYNSSAIYSKVSVEQSSDVKPGQQIRRNVVSLKKSLYSSIYVESTNLRKDPSFA